MSRNSNSSILSLCKSAPPWEGAEIAFQSLCIETKNIQEQQWILNRETAYRVLKKYRALFIRTRRSSNTQHLEIQLQRVLEKTHRFGAKQVFEEEALSVKTKARLFLKVQIICFILRPFALFGLKAKKRGLSFLSPK